METTKIYRKVSGGAMDSSKGFNEFFYESEAEKPSWMSNASEGSAGSATEDEEKLLDDVQACDMSRICSIDSSRTYSRACSLESQESDYNDQETETEVVLRVAMCCASCVNKVKSLTQLEGVTSVTCDRKTEKVTVIGTARPRDVLEACKKLFEQSKIWIPEDTFGDLDPAPKERSFGLQF